VLWFLFTAASTGLILSLGILVLGESGAVRPSRSSPIRLGGRDVGSQARHRSRNQERPGQDAAPSAEPVESSSSDRT